MLVEKRCAGVDSQVLHVERVTLIGRLQSVHKGRDTEARGEWNQDRHLKPCSPSSMFWVWTVLTTIGLVNS